jgi:hypothetical protein
MKVHQTLTAILLTIAIALCLTASYRHINLSSTIILLIFNLLFITLIFQLKGALIKKAFILATGNVLGFFCNLLFFNLSYAGLTYFQSFDKEFNAIYTLTFPFLNLLWIVPFWSFSLSLLVDRNPPN